MKYFAVKKLQEPWLYAIVDPLENAHIYLSIGKERALIYDTAHGMEPMLPYIREITDLPVTCLLSHGHGDHANGSYEFDEVLVTKEDYEICLKHTGRTARSRLVGNLELEGVTPPKDFDAEAYIERGKETLKNKLKTVEFGHVFDLGGLRAEVIQMEGHTSGVIGLFFKEKKVLLTSDGAAPYLQWMFLNESRSVKEFIAMLERNFKLDFEIFYDAHSGRTYTREDFSKLINAAKNVDIKKSVPFPKLPERNGHVYTEDDVSIIFSEDKL